MSRSTSTPITNDHMVYLRHWLNRFGIVPCAMLDYHDPGSDEHHFSVVGAYTNRAGYVLRTHRLGTVADSDHLGLAGMAEVARKVGFDVESDPLSDLEEYVRLTLFTRSYAFPHAAREGLVPSDSFETLFNRASALTRVTLPADYGAEMLVEVSRSALFAAFGGAL